MTIEKRSGAINTLFAALLFMVICSVYALTMSGHFYSIDGMAMFQQSKRLLFHHTLRFSPPFVWHDLSATYTPWPEGLSIAYLLPMALYGYVIRPGDSAFHAMPSDPVSLLHDPSYIYLSLTNSIITALTACVLFGLATWFGLSRYRAFLLALVYGLASPAFAYAKQDFAQPLAALLMMVTFWCYLKAEDAGKTRGAYLFCAGALLGFLVMTRPETALIVAAPLVVLSILQWKRMTIVLLVPFALLVGLHIWVNHIKTGGLAGAKASAFFTRGTVGGFLTGFAGLLVSPGRGLLVFFPLAAFAPVGLYRMCRGSHRRWAILFSAVIILHLLVFAAWPCWWGGLSWGPRFLIPVLPILTLMAFWPSAERRSHYATGLAKAFVIMAGLVMTLSGVLLHWEVVSGRPSSVKDNAQRYFRPDSNVLWTNWRDMEYTSRYDVFLKKRTGQIMLDDGTILYPPYDVAIYP